MPFIFIIGQIFRIPGRPPKAPTPIPPIRVLICNSGRDNDSVKLVTFASNADRDRFILFKHLKKNVIKIDSILFLICIEIEANAHIV